MDDGKGHDVEILALYALRSLGDADTRAVEEHLLNCARCRAELASFSMVSDLLEDVPAELFDEDRYRGPEPRPSLPAQEPARPGRWRVSIPVAAAAAVVTLGAGILVGRDIASPAVPSPPAVQAGIRSASAADPHTGARLVVHAVPATAWVRIQASVTGVVPGQLCRLVVVSRAGHREAAGSWVAPAAQAPATDVDGSAAVAPSDVAAVEVDTPDGTPLVVARF